MNYYDCEIPPADYISMGETEWNLPLIMPPPPRKTLTSVYGNSTPFFPGYLRSPYACRPKRLREFHPFNYKQFPKKEMVPGRPCSSHDWNFPRKNAPNNLNYYNSSMIPLAYPPYNLRRRFDSHYTQSGGDELELQNYSNKLIFPKKPVHPQNILHRESEYSDLQNYGNFNASQDMWDSNVVQALCDPPYNQNMLINRSLLQSSKTRNVCEEVIPSLIKNTEIPCITYPERNSNPEKTHVSSPCTITQTVSVDNPITEKETEGTNFSLNNIQDQNTVENEIPKICENSLDFMDETALSVYFLNDIYLNSQNKGNVFDSPLSSENNSLQNSNEETNVNRFFDEIGDFEIEITSANEELGSMNETNLTRSLDMNSGTEIGDTELKEITEQAKATGEEPFGCLMDNNENCSGIKQNNDNLDASTASNYESGINDAGLTENLNINTPSIKDLVSAESTDMVGVNTLNIEGSDYHLNNYSNLLSNETTDMVGLNTLNLEDSDNHLNNYSGRKKCKKGNLRVSTRKVIKNRARVCKKREARLKKNINHKIHKSVAEQNVIFHAPIININHQNQISTSFDSIKLLDGFDNKLHQNLGNGIKKLLYSLQNNCDEKCAELDTCLLATNESRMPNENNTKMTTGITNLSSANKELTFIYSGVLETLPNYIETSLSSVTNYVLGEPKETAVKKCDSAFELSDIKYPPIAHENFDVRFSPPASPCLTSEKDIDSSIKLLDNMFQPDSPGYSSTTQETLKNSQKRTKHKGKKIKLKKLKQIRKRLVGVKPRPVSCLSNFYYNKLKSTRSSRSTNALNQSKNKLYRVAFSQTSESESNSFSGIPIPKQDAQTQWDILDVTISSEIFDYEEIDNKRASRAEADKSLSKEQGITISENQTENKSERNKYVWNLRPRKCVSAIKSANCSDINTRRDTNVKSATYNSLEGKTRQNAYKNLLFTKKKLSEAETDIKSQSQVKATSEIILTGNPNFKNKKINRKLQGYRKTAAQSLYSDNHKKFYKLRNNRTLTNMKKRP